MLIMFDKVVAALIPIRIELMLNKDVLLLFFRIKSSLNIFAESKWMLSPVSLHLAL